MMGKIDSKMRWGQQRMKSLDSINSMDMSLSKFLEMVRERGAWCATVDGIAVRHDLATEQQQQQQWLLSFILEQKIEERKGEIVSQ